MSMVLLSMAHLSRSNCISSHGKQAIQIIDLLYQCRHLHQSGSKGKDNIILHYNCKVALTLKYNFDSKYHSNMFLFHTSTSASDAYTASGSSISPTYYKPSASELSVIRFKSQKHHSLSPTVTSSTKKQDSAYSNTAYFPSSKVAPSPSGTPSLSSAGSRFTARPQPRSNHFRQQTTPSINNTLLTNKVLFYFIYPCY